MNKTGIIIAIVVTGLATSFSYGQEKEEKKEIRKEVRIEDQDGVQTLTIITTEGGKTVEEKFTGEEAEKKMAELMEAENIEPQEEEEVTKDIEVEMVDGEKVVTITTKNKGKFKKEVYTGEDAEEKLKELESEEKGTKKVVKKEIRVVREE